MATFTVDLPAHNIGREVGGITTPLADPECLADPSATTGITLNAYDTYWVGFGGSALGFGFFDLPAGATLVDVRFVAHAQRLTPSFPVPPGSWDYTVVAPVPTTGPSLSFNYDDRRPNTGALGHDIGYAITPTDTLAEAVGAPIIHAFNDLVGPIYDTVIAGIGTPPSNESIYGLYPSITMADTAWWEPYPGSGEQILLTYLALRVTYTTGDVAPPCHLYPRDDDQGVGSAAIWPPPSSNRPGSYY